MEAGYNCGLLREIHEEKRCCPLRTVNSSERFSAFQLARQDETLRGRGRGMRYSSVGGARIWWRPGCEGFADAVDSDANQEGLSRLPGLLSCCRICGAGFCFRYRVEIVIARFCGFSSAGFVVLVPGGAGGAGVAVPGGSGGPGEGVPGGSGGAGGDVLGGGGGGGVRHFVVSFLEGFCVCPCTNNSAGLRALEPDEWAAASCAPLTTCCHPKNSPGSACAGPGITAGQTGVPEAAAEGRGRSFLASAPDWDSAPAGNRKRRYACAVVRAHEGERVGARAAVVRARGFAFDGGMSNSTVLVCGLSFEVWVHWDDVVVAEGLIPEVAFSRPARRRGHRVWGMVFLP